jgi:hypothetical protein
MIVKKYYPTFMNMKKSYPSSPNSCYEDYLQLSLFKESIDYHKLNLGNPLKSNVTLDKLKQMESDYNNQKKLYEASECINNFEKNKCQYLYKNIMSLQGSNMVNKIFEDPLYKKDIKARLDETREEYKKLNCEAIVSTSRAEYVSSAINVFNQLDTKRIESQSIYERNKRVIFGGVVLILGIALIMNFKKSEK